MKYLRAILQQTQQDTDVLCDVVYQMIISLFQRIPRRMFSVFGNNFSFSFFTWIDFYVILPNAILIRPNKSQYTSTSHQLSQAEIGLGRNGQRTTGLDVQSSHISNVDWHWIVIATWTGNRCV